MKKPTPAIIRPLTSFSKTPSRSLRPILNSTQSTQRLQFSNSSARSIENRVCDPIRIPPTFHDYLRLASSNNALLLTLFTTSACAPCRVITPLLADLVKSRASLPQDKYSALLFSEVELDSPDTSNGNMMDLGVEWGITSLPTLVGFGGRRSEKVTDRLVDTALMSDKKRLKEWVDEQMAKGDPFGSGGAASGGILSHIFGG